MIPTIEQILTDLRNGDMEPVTALHFIREHIRLAEERGTDDGLRDHFAGLAMQGVVSQPGDVVDEAKLAAWSYTMADAMLKARAANEGEGV